MTLIDDVVQGLGREISKVKVRSQELMKSYNLSQEIRELERRKTTKFVEIGRLVYDKYELKDEINDEVFKERVKEIVAFENDILQLQAELEALQLQNDPSVPASKKADAKAGYTATPGFMCPRCHAPANKEKAYCPTCGEPLSQQLETEVE